MSHDIDLSTGKPAMAYVGEKPWHRLGEELPEGQPIETWLKAARLEWDLKRLPVQYLVDGRVRTMEDRFVLVRSDTSTALSIVSGDYHIVQPKQVLEFYRDLVGSYGYTLETAGALNGGRKVWALARTGKASFADESTKDQLAAYVLLATSCDKSLATTVAFTSIRVVCDNTLNFAMKDVKEQNRRKLTIPHSFRFDAEEVKAQLQLLDAAWERFIRTVRKMAARSMKSEQSSAFFEVVLGKKADKPLSQKAQRELETILALLRSAPGQDLKATKETLWGTLNAVTYYVDHIRGGSTGDRLDSAWFGSGCAMKDRAWMEASRLLTN